MLKRTLLMLVALASLTVVLTGCGNDHDVKVEQHEEINTEQTVSSQMVVE